MPRTLLTILIVVGTLVPAAAEVRIKSSPGGQIGQFLEMFESVRETGERVVIDGPCLSACTLVLGVVPRNRICVTPRAVLGFHAAWRPAGRGRTVPEHEATQLMMDIYPSEVRGWILRRGGLNGHMIWLRGPELAAMYQRCA